MSFDSQSNMTSNTIFPFTPTPAPSFRKMLQKISNLYINTVIGILGFIGNSVSATALVKGGLNKPSYILLFSLAVSDCLCLVKTVDVASLIRIFTPSGGWHFSYSATKACFELVRVTYVTTVFGARLSMMITLLIMLERLIAVFFPLHFSKLVTPRRTWTAVVVCLLFWLPYIILQSLYIDLKYEYNPEYGSYIGTVKLTKYYLFARKNRLIAMVDHMKHTVPTVLITLGCIVLAIKLHRAFQERKKLVSKSATASFSLRTTLTLLMVSVLFSITHMVFIIGYLPMIDVGGVPPTLAALVVVTLAQTLNFLNSSFNFLIYVAFHDKLRALIIEVIVPKTCYKLYFGDLKKNTVTSKTHGR